MEILATLKLPVRIRRLEVVSFSRIEFLLEPLTRLSWCRRINMLQETTLIAIRPVTTYPKLIRLKIRIVALWTKVIFISRCLHTYVRHLDIYYSESRRQIIPIRNGWMSYTAFVSAKMSNYATKSTVSRKKPNVKSWKWRTCWNKLKISLKKWPNPTTRFGQY